MLLHLGVCITFTGLLHALYPVEGVKKRVIFSK